MLAWFLIDAAEAGWAVVTCVHLQHHVEPLSLSLLLHPLFYTRVDTRGQFA